MPLNTFVAGNVGSVRALCGSLGSLGTGVEDTATGLHKARSDSEADWEGQAGDAFRATAERDGKDADRLAQLYTDLATALTSFADDLDTVDARMQQARQVAGAGQLLVFGQMIYPPPDLPAPPASVTNPSLPGRPPAPDPAAAALHTQQQAAYSEAESTVNEARDLERAAHRTLQDALKTNSSGLNQLGQHNAWMQAAAAPTTPAAARLASAAATMDNGAANATHSMFEQAIAAGPAQTRAMWDLLTPDQQTELEDRFPDMIGNANGLPAQVRSDLNKKLLDQQRLVIAGKLQTVEQQLEELPPGKEFASARESLRAEIKKLQDNSSQLTNIYDYVHQPDKYLLSINATANGDRGEAIIASGNPDTATNVVTTVPGTFNDVRDVMGYVRDGDEVIAHAQPYAQPGQTFSAITYTGYESPPDLATASSPVYAEQGENNLANFQEGLRVSHQGPPGNNTVIGHSYGSTVVGYAARDHNGISADNLVFIGSPGVGVEHANQLGVPPGQVWGGKSSGDLIGPLTPSPDPYDHRSGPLVGTSPKEQWFGRSPIDPQFGGNVLPTHAGATHNDYWKYPESLDGMARIVAGNPEGTGVHP